MPRYLGTWLLTDRITCAQRFCEPRTTTQETILEEAAAVWWCSRGPGRRRGDVGHEKEPWMKNLIAQDCATFGRVLLYAP